MAYSVVVAGTTQNTVACAQALENHPDFALTGVLTPVPKPVGRKKLLTENPLHLFALDKDLPHQLVEKKIEKNQIEVLEKKADGRPDILLVVDFGYLIPTWLLQWPKIAPLNVHPSLLPKWRGSSPGQFALLYGEKKSAITLMVMNEKLDEGPIISQQPFAINYSWNHQDYYQHSFEIVQKTIAKDILNFASGKITAQPQPDRTPTPTAGKLTKSDAFISWKVVQAAMTGAHKPPTRIESAVLEQALTAHSTLSSLIAHAARAFDPWPQLWTTIQTPKGNLRMKILRAADRNGKLELQKVHIEGQNPADWNQVKNNLR